MAYFLYYSISGRIIFIYFRHKYIISLFFYWSVNCLYYWNEIKREVFFHLLGVCGGMDDIVTNICTTVDIVNVILHLSRAPEKYHLSPYPYIPNNSFCFFSLS